MATKGIIKSAFDMFRPVQATTMVERYVQVTPEAGKSAEIKQDDTPKPMEELAALWQTDPNARTPVNPLATPLFNTDPKAIATAASKMDFVSGISPELMAKAMGGNDPAAFMQVLNQVAQKTLATSTQLNAATIETATTRNNERMLAAIPGQVKQANLNEMQSDNPVLQHPGTQPFLQLVRGQLQMKNPDMSAAEINRQAEAALTGFAQTLATPVTATPNTGSSNEGGTNWAQWAGT